MAGSTGARAITSADQRGKRGQRKRKTGTMQKNTIKTKAKFKSAGVEGGRVKILASKTPSGRKNVPERATYETQLARAEWISCPSLRGHVETWRRITKKISPTATSEQTGLESSTACPGDRNHYSLFQLRSTTTASCNFAIQPRCPPFLVYRALSGYRTFTKKNTQTKIYIRVMFIVW